MVPHDDFTVQVQVRVVHDAVIANGQVRMWIVPTAPADLKTARIKELTANPDIVSFDDRVGSDVRQVANLEFPKALDVDVISERDLIAYDYFLGLDERIVFTY